MVTMFHFMENFFVVSIYSNCLNLEMNVLISHLYSMWDLNSHLNFQQ